MHFFSICCNMFHKTRVFLCISHQLSKQNICFYRNQWYNDTWKNHAMTYLNPEAVFIIFHIKYLNNKPQAHESRNWKWAHQENIILMIKLHWLSLFLSLSLSLHINNTWNTGLIFWLVNISIIKSSYSNLIVRSIHVILTYVSDNSFD